MKSAAKTLRTLLILGRVSNLPTVWSNLLAGWFIAGGRGDPKLVPLLLGGSLLYVGGMYLNDFCDTRFDAQFCHERPIPAGNISRHAVGILAVAWFMAGLACLAPLGRITAGIALLLVALIALYDFRHKNVAWAPLVMGGCRFLLYPLAASSERAEISWPIFMCGAALGFYVAGITYVARGESRPEKPARWALPLLLLPFVAGTGMAAGLRSSLPPVAAAGLLLLGWIAWLLVPLWRKSNRSIGRVVSGLLAGIVLVDAIALSSVAGFYAGWLLVFFGLALLLQRLIPAT
jgi:4-hydroxybenzoate polyprenyltransferase